MNASNSVISPAEKRTTEEKKERNNIMADIGLPMPGALRTALKKLSETGEKKETDA